jgi:hypothetical protein
MSEQKTYTVEQLVAAGGRLWEVAEKNMRRVYFNSLADRIGLSVSYYKTGNVSSASLNGKEISNTSARKILTTLEFGKVWYDLNTNRFETKNLGDYADEIIESIESDLNPVQTEPATTTEPELAKIETPITITRTERVMITGNAAPIDENHFDDRKTAGAWLKQHVPQITDAHLDEIFSTDETHFEINEMVNRGIAAYTAQVVYQITVKHEAKND